MFNKVAKNLGEEAAKSAISTVKDTAKNDATSTLKKLTPILGLFTLYICFNHKERTVKHLTLMDGTDFFIF